MSVTHFDLAQCHADLGIPADYAAARGLSLQREVAERELVCVHRHEGREIRLQASAAVAWSAMRDAASTEHIDLLPLSGFRSTARQTELIRGKLARGQLIAEILAVNAAPGYSEHHTGRALDISTHGNAPFEESFAVTPAFSWLVGHAGKFGFTLSYPSRNPHGIAYEPWHWCWSPLSARP